MFQFIMVAIFSLLFVGLLMLLVYNIDKLIRKD